jgi:DNA-binding transcriptional ArsR family regulator
MKLLIKLYRTTQRCQHFGLRVKNECSILSLYKKQGDIMRTKPEKRLLAERLRRDHGLSYREISILTGISRSTLSSWLRAIPLTPEQEARLQDRLRRNRSSFAARALPINRERYRRARQRLIRFLKIYLRTKLWQN